MDVTKEQKWMTSQEAADYLRVGVGTLAEFRRFGMGPDYYRGGIYEGKIIYNMQDLNEFMKKRRVVE